MPETTKAGFVPAMLKSCLWAALLLPVHLVHSKDFTPDKVSGWLAMFGPEYSVEKCIVSDISAETVHCYDLDRKEMRAIKLSQVAAIYMQRNGVNYEVKFTSGSKVVTVKNEATVVVEGEYEAMHLYKFIPRMELPGEYEYYIAGGIYYVRPKAVAPKPNAGVSRRTFFMGIGLSMGGDDYIGWSMILASRFVPIHYDMLYNRKKYQEGNNYIQNNLNKFTVGSGFRVTRFASLKGNVSYYRGNIVTDSIHTVKQTTEKIRAFSYGGGLLLNLKVKKKNRIGFGAYYEYSPLSKEWLPYFRGYLLF